MRVITHVLAIRGGFSQVHQRFGIQIAQVLPDMMNGEAGFLRVQSGQRGCTVLLTDEGIDELISALVSIRRSAGTNGGGNGQE